MHGKRHQGAEDQNEHERAVELPQQEAKGVSASVLLDGIRAVSLQAQGLGLREPPSIAMSSEASTAQYALPSSTSGADRCTVLSMAAYHRPGRPSLAQQVPDQSWGGLFPEGFHFGKVCMRFLGAVEQLVHVSLFLLQQPVRVFPELISVFDQGLALREVVQRAELVLQILERGECRLAPLGIRLAGKDAGEELDRVAQILGPDAQFMALFDIERAQLCAVLPDPLPSAGKKLGSVLGNGYLAPLTQLRVARPGAGLDPLGDAEQRIAKPVGADRFGCSRVGFGAR